MKKLPSSFIPIELTSSDTEKLTLQILRIKFPNVQVDLSLPEKDVTIHTGSTNIDDVKRVIDPILHSFSNDLDTKFYEEKSSSNYDGDGATVRKPLLRLYWKDSDGNLYHAMTQFYRNDPYDEWEINNITSMTPPPKDVEIVEIVSFFPISIFYKS